MKATLEFLASNDKLVTAWTAIAALFVSFLSIVLTCVNLRMQRTHNRKSVCPIGQITVGDYENSIFVRLRNDGVGPLIIEKVAVFRDDREEDSEIAIIEFMPELPDGYQWETFLRDIRGRAISANEQLTLIALKGEPSDSAFVRAREIAREALATLTVKVFCKNIYDEQMPLTERKLNWFARSH